MLWMLWIPFKWITKWILVSFVFNILSFIIWFLSVRNVHKKVTFFLPASIESPSAVSSPLTVSIWQFIFKLLPFFRFLTIYPHQLFHLVARIAPGKTDWEGLQESGAGPVELSIVRFTCSQFSSHLRSLMKREGNQRSVVTFVFVFVCAFVFVSLYQFSSEVFYE